MTLAEFVAAHRLSSLPCNLLSSLLTALGLKGHSKLNHWFKAEFFLKHQGWAPDAIAEALEHLKIRTRKKKEEQENQRQEAEERGEEPPEDRGTKENLA